MDIQLALTAATLVVTIFSLFYNASKQSTLVEQQRAANQRLESFKTSSSRTVKLLEECLDWLDQGFGIYTTYINKITSRREMHAAGIDARVIEEFLSEQRNEIDEWTAKLPKYIGYAKHIWDKRYKRNREAEELAVFLSQFF